MLRSPENDLWTIPIWVDFMALDERGRVPLDFPGTVEDLARYEVSLREGMKIVLYTHDATEMGDPDDLVAVGMVTYDENVQRWFAVIDARTLRHVSALDEVDRSLYHRQRGA
jgi:hypothetical protein